MFIHLQTKMYFVSAFLHYTQSSNSGIPKYKITKELLTQFFVRHKLQFFYYESRGTVKAPRTIQNFSDRELQTCSYHGTCITSVQPQNPQSLTPPHPNLYGPSTKKKTTYSYPHTLPKKWFWPTSFITESHALLVPDW